MRSSLYCFYRNIILHTTSNFVSSLTAFCFGKAFANMLMFNPEIGNVEWNFSLTHLLPILTKQIFLSYSLSLTHRYTNTHTRMHLLPKSHTNTHIYIQTHSLPFTISHSFSLSLSLSLSLHSIIHSLSLAHAFSFSTFFISIILSLFILCISFLLTKVCVLDNKTLKTISICFVYVNIKKRNLFHINNFKWSCFLIFRNNT